MSQLCPGSQEGRWHRACISNSVTSRTGAGIVPLSSALLGDSECGVQLWAPHSDAGVGPEKDSRAGVVRSG